MYRLIHPHALRQSCRVIPLAQIGRCHEIICGQMLFVTVTVKIHSPILDPAKQYFYIPPFPGIGFPVSHPSPVGYQYDNFRRTGSMIPNNHPHPLQPYFRGRKPVAIQILAIHFNPSFHSSHLVTKSILYHLRPRIATTIRTNQ